jgi:hypothetical protein
VKLFDECYAAAMEARSPSLPFDEAHWSCLVYVAQFRPDIIVDYVGRHGPDHFWFQLCNKAQEIMGKPPIKWPKYRAPKPPKYKRWLADFHKNRGEDADTITLDEVLILEGQKKIEIPADVLKKLDTIANYRTNPHGWRKVKSFLE